MSVDFSLLREEDLAELDAYIDGVEDKEGSLIAILHRAQSIFGYLPEALQVHIARKTGISTAKVFGVVTFYSFFNMKPRAKHTIQVCMGTACFVKGAEGLLEGLKEELGTDIGEITSDGMFMVEQVHCLGACSLAPVIFVDGNVHGKVNRDELPKIIESYYVTAAEEGPVHAE